MKVRNAFTVVELLVVVAILAVLLSILIPSLARAKELTRRAVDVSHIHEFIGVCHEYGAEHKSYLPEGRRQDYAHDDYVWFRLSTWQTLRDVYGQPEEGTYCQGLGRQPWLFRPRAVSAVNTLIGWIYWGRREDIYAGGELAYRSPRTLNQPSAPSSRTLLTCWCYDSFSPGALPWGSWAPHVGGTMAYYPAGVPMDPRPEGLAVGYLDGAAAWVAEPDLAQIDQADRLYHDPR